MSNRTRLTTLEPWVHAKAARHGISRVHPGGLSDEYANAFTVGVPALGGCRIVVGDRRLETMRELRAIVAHELAHVVRRDVATLAAITSVALMLYAFVVRPAFGMLDAGHTLAAFGLSSLAAAVLIAILPGWFRRRIEYRADALAVELTGDPEALCSALIRLAQLKKDPLDRRFLRHPSTLARIEAIRATHR